MKKMQTKVALSTMVLALGLTILPATDTSQQVNWGATQVEAATAVNYTAKENLNLRSGASWKHSSLALIPKGKQVTYISTSGSWYKVKYGTKTGYVSSSYLTKVVVKAPVVPKASVVTNYTAKENLNLRSGASWSTKSVTVIPKGKQVQYISTSGSWYKVKYGTKTGYVSASYLTKVVPPAPKPVVKPAPKPVVVTKYATKANLNLRTSASTSGKVLLMIPKGKQVDYISTSGTWYKVKYGTKTGYVSASYLTKVVPPAPKPVVKPAPKPAPVVVPAPKPVTKPTTPVKVSSPAVNYVATDALNMRSGASTSYGILISIPKGKTVTYVSTSGAWFKVMYGGKTGYVNSVYLVKPGESYFPAPAKATQGYSVGDVLIINSKHPLPSTYNPGMNATAKRAMETMFADAKKQGYLLRITSSYRSFADQAALKKEYTQLYGKAYADAYVATPGLSEHQAGLAYDIGGTKAPFSTSKEFTWMKANAHKYGFHMRFMAGKEKITGVPYEPWHYRYVGDALATTLKANGKALEEHLNIVGK